MPGSSQRATTAEEAAMHAASIYGLDPDLLLAVMWKESCFGHLAKGKAGEIGLMQIMPGTGREWADRTKQPDFQVDELYDAKRNAEAGAWYIQRGLKLWEHKVDPLPYALARYNAGQSRVLKWEKGTSNANEFIDSIGIKSTQHYVRDVLDRYGSNLRKRMVRTGL